MPARPGSTLSQRARDELAALVGPGGAASPRARGPRLALAAAAVVMLVAVAGVFVLLRSPTSTSEPTADQPYYASAEALEGAAETIVRATVAETDQRVSDGSDETVATLSVSGVAKGEAAEGGQLRVSYPTPGGGPEAPEELAVGREYVFLLVECEGVTSLVSTLQGYYPIVDGQAVAVEGNPVALSAEVTQALGLG